MELHVATIYEGKILHRMRQLNGDWTPWGAIVPPEGHAYEDVSCAASGNALHIVVRDVNGIYWHDIRLPNGSWQGMSQLPGQPLLGSSPA